MDIYDLLRKALESAHYESEEQRAEYLQACDDLAAGAAPQPPAADTTTSGGDA
jgi:hypothetical protein